MLIKGGTIIDGTERKRFKGDIRIDGNKISAVGDLKPLPDEKIIDATGLFVSPGFVDILNHSDAYVTLFENPAQESLLRQGITSILMGNCGSSLAPLTDGVFVNSIQKWGDISRINVNWLSMGEYIEELKKHKFGVNIATLAGHSTVRRGLVQSDPGGLNKEELGQMTLMLKRSLDEGAFGISSGLAYAHGEHAHKEEISKIARLAESHKSVYSVHIRDESEHFKKSINEILEMARQTKANIEISHLKVVGEKFWDQFTPALKEIEKVRNVNFDVYPYTVTASVLYSFLPKWASKGGNKSLIPNIQNGQTREKLIKDMENDPYSYGDMTVAMGNINPTYFGRKIKDIAKNQDASPEEAVLNLIDASGNRVIVFTQTISEYNLKKALAHNKSFITSDGAGYKAEGSGKGEVVHPRNFGAMPRFLGKYIREYEIMSWEKAIAKITSLPAEKIGFKNRGQINQGYFADIVIFDPSKITDTATFENPFQYPRGIEYVFVNGKVAVENNILKQMEGKILENHAKK
ncbi:MAG: amidohydrolase family protein [Candidatus Spechtbacterales bacterium]